MNINIGETTISQYSIMIRAQTRDFIGNHGGSNVGVWTFYVNDPLDLCTALWNNQLNMSIEMLSSQIIIAFLIVNGWILPKPSQILILLFGIDVTQKRNILCTTLDGLRLHRYKTSHRDYE